MPKMKTNRGAAKRFKLTGSGKVRYKRSNARHQLTAKSPSRKRQMRKAGIGSKVDERRVKRLLGVG
jgi:large subunit ribosomal protein L35